MARSRTLIILLPFFAAAFFITSCIKEDQKDCNRYISRIKVVDADLNDITASGVVRSISLYLFDDNGFVREIKTDGLIPVFLGYDIRKPFTLVAWGNINTDSLQAAQLFPGASLKESWMQARAKTNGLLQPLGDLFYGRQVFHEIDTRNEKEMYVILNRCVAGLSIRTVHLTERFGQSAEYPSIEVRGASNAMNFLGNYAASNIAYEPNLAIDSQNELYTSVFQVFQASEEQAVEIDIFRGKDKLITIKTDNDGNPLYLVTGKHTEIIIDFGKNPEVSVTANVLNWKQQTDQETEM